MFLLIVEATPGQVGLARLGQAADFQLVQEAGSQLVPVVGVPQAQAADFPQARVVDSLQVPVAGIQQAQAAAFPQDRVAASLQAPVVDFQQAQAVDSLPALAIIGDAFPTNR